MGAGTIAMERGPTGLARKAVVIVAVLFLLWFVGAQGLAAIAASSSNPALLALFDPARHPAVGRKQAQVDLLAQRPDRAIASARAATLSDPMNVRAVRTLGLSLENRDPARATRVMRMAEQLSWRDTPTSLWVMRDAAQAGEVERVMQQIDALARRQTESRITGQLFFAGFADAPSRAAFAALLAKDPPWRGRFFADIRTRLPPRSYDDMTALLDRLDRTGRPTRPAERMTFIDRMVDTGDGAMARDYWFRTFRIPPADRARTPHDPAFRAVASRRPDAVVSPFEWKIGPDADQLVAFRHGDAGRILDISPAPDVVTLMTQTLVLPPGTHRIDADIIEGQPLLAPAGWQVVCVPSGGLLIRTFETRGNELSGVTVTVPPTGCDVQTLTLTGLERIDAQPVAIRSVIIRSARASGN